MFGFSDKTNFFVGDHVVHFEDVLVTFQRTAVNDQQLMLIELDFLNEERFARSYVRGKFRINKWGRNKILNGLRMKRVPDYCIEKGLDEIDEEEYRSVLKELIDRKLKGSDQFEIKRKAIASMQSKGYETGVILDVMKGG